ncbi:DUF167 domain-containing protein [Actinokineospora pegani]|uniref:DUF167 domain-containing protein n=1 Tax=Actinokineospora pegani TaxID=2654637 RepID=UPI0012EA4E2E|nr:DUF167 domain-containing protein [Actinokineospora pegani]
MRFTIRVRPGARADAVGGRRGDALVVSVAAPAVEGRANEAVCKVLAGAFGVRARDVAIVHGDRGRDKLVEIEPAPPDGPGLLARLRDSAS